MSSSFRLIGGKYASEAFQSNVILTNPLAGLVIGVIVTVIVQSSSTATSIVVSMVASEIIQVKYAIPIIMGSNIGTSVTSTLVSLGQLGNKEEFTRAFAGATVHDMFNVLTVSVLLPIEIITGYLEKVTKLIVTALLKRDISAKEPEMLSALTKPLTNVIVQLDKKALEQTATGGSNSTEEFRLLKHCSKRNSFNLTIQYNSTSSNGKHSCFYILEKLPWPEWAIGLLLLIFSLIVLCGCLVLMVKILNSIFQGPVAKLLQKVVNADFPGPFRYLTPYLAILLGCVLTIIIQSSSVFTSTLTPLVGLGLVTLERVFPLTLGSNIGTTITGILAAFSASYKALHHSLQIALCHTLFNVTGIAIWFPIPFLRKFPLNMARFLGNTAGEYRWFCLVYIFGVFFVIPIIIFALSIAGWIYLGIVLAAVFILLLSVSIINILQTKKPNLLPPILRTWEFLPKPLRSLEPYDAIIFKYLFCCKCCNKLKVKNENNESTQVESKKEDPQICSDYFEVAVKRY